MSCDYPCHICDPEEWAEETKPPPYDMDKIYGRTESALEKAFDKDASIMWWVPMEGQMQGLTLREECKYDEFCIAPRIPVMTMLVAQDYWLEGRGRDGRKYGFPIISYMTKILDRDKGLTYVSAVQSRTPPPWGWWMPTLNP
jgi:hypothetical protein